MLDCQAVSATLTPTIRGQRPQTPSTPTITMQDLGVTVATVGTSPAITVAAQAAAARSALQTTVASSIPTAGKKLAALTTVGRKFHVFISIIVCIFSEH